MTAHNSIILSIFETALLQSVGMLTSIIAKLNIYFI